MTRRTLLAAPAALAVAVPGAHAAPSAPVDPAPALAAPVTIVTTCPAAPTPTRGAPPSPALRGAFGVLRRPARPEDALPREALDALRRRGLAPADAAAARLLRTTPQGGRAWVVPVADVRAAFPFACAPARPLRPRRGRRPARPVPVPAPAPVPAPVPVPARPARPAEGLAVVALGGAPAGGGGALADLVRGCAPVAVDPCAGPGRDMLAVSGIVPDGVPAAYLTSPDGTAVRADVHDNGFAFVVPRGRGPGQRYVVWTGGDGTPHVQPVPFGLRLPRRACARVPEGLAQVTPGLAALPVPVAVPPVAPRPRTP